MLAEEHAAWHLARTVPDILNNRRWPTAKLKTGGVVAAGVGTRPLAGGGANPRSELEGLVGELRAYDPRALEMAGIEVNQTTTHVKKEV